MVEVIRHIVQNSQFDTAIKQKLESSVDLEIYQTEENSLKENIRQLTAAKERLGNQIDRLDDTDRHYEEKYHDMQNRIDSLYDEIAEVSASLETVQMQIRGIREEQISQERVYEFLELFDIMYDKFTEAEKKEFFHSFIKRIEIYPEPLENGQILKSIQFRFPVYYQGNEANTFFPNLENTVESIVLLYHKLPDSVINVTVEFGEGEGKVSLDAIAERAKKYQPKPKITYKMIQEYVEKKYGFKVHTAYIAEVKRSLGLTMYDAPNAVEELKQPRKRPPKEKIEAITDALKYFEVI